MNKNVRRSWISYQRNVPQHTFGTIFMRQLIFNHYVNEFRTYFFFCIHRGKREKCIYITTQCTKETCILGGNQINVKDKEITIQKKKSLELLHKRLVHRSTRSLLSGDTGNVWEDMEFRIDPYPFFTSCQIYLMNKKARSKIPLKQKSSFKFVLWI